jgi:hypothetical protein
VPPPGSLPKLHRASISLQSARSAGTRHLVPTLPIHLYLLIFLMCSEFSGDGLEGPALQSLSLVHLGPFSVWPPGAQVHIQVRGGGRGRLVLCHRTRDLGSPEPSPGFESVLVQDARRHQGAKSLYKQEGWGRGTDFKKKN